MNVRPDSLVVFRSTLSRTAPPHHRPLSKGASIRNAVFQQQEANNLLWLGALDYLTTPKEAQMRTKWLVEMLALVTCFATVPSAVAGNPGSGCDVVTLSGSGTRLESGVTVGSSTMTVVATGEQIPVGSRSHRWALRTFRMARLLLSHRMSSKG